MARALVDLTTKITRIQAAECIEYLTNGIDTDYEIDWSYVYTLFEAPMLCDGEDCSERCNKHLPFKQQQRVKQDGVIGAVCCRGSYGAVQIVQLVDESEYLFLSDKVDESLGSFVRDVDDPDTIYFYCYLDKCDRKHRPFWCRAYPFLPVFDKAGSVVGLYGYTTKPVSDDGQPCELVFEDLSSEWKDHIVEGWKHMVRSAEGRQFLIDFLRGELDQHVYGFTA